MSVLILAYSRLEQVIEHDPLDGLWCNQGDHVQAFAYRSFRRSFDGLPTGQHDSDPQSSFTGGHCFAVTDQTQRHEVLATGYPAFGEWRETLTRVFYGCEPREVWHNLDRYQSHPFIEIVNFADNEGCLGPNACERLLAAFTHQPHRDRWAAEALTTQRPWATPDYWWSSWIEGLSLAVNGGLVSYR